MEKVFEIYIKTTPERLWAADPRNAPSTCSARRSRATGRWGSRYTMSVGNGTVTLGEAKFSRWIRLAAWSRRCAHCGTRP